MSWSSSGSGGTGKLKVVRLELKEGDLKEAANTAPKKDEIASLLGPAKKENEGEPALLVYKNKPYYAVSDGADWCLFEGNKVV